MRVESAEQKYLNEVFGLEDAELAQIRHELRRHNVDHMSVSPSEARLLQFLIRSLGLKRIVEIGTLFGFSTLAMAKALPEDGEIWTIEKNPVNFEIAHGHFSKFAAGKKINPLVGDALPNLKLLEFEGPFDMVFIDADKGGYVNYLNWAEEQVRPGGFIIGDNSYLFGAVWGEPREGEESSGPRVEVMREFNRRLSDPKKYNSTLIPTHEGLTIAQKI